ncbi:MAG TPA: hypothetical protein VLA02_02560, partial [Reyranella sp.]|nr:hypothetical protein [Reyranella sp.]
MLAASAAHGATQAASAVSSRRAPFSVSHTMRLHGSLSIIAISTSSSSLSVRSVRDSVDWSSPIRLARALTVSSLAEAISAISPHWANETPVAAKRCSTNWPSRRAAGKCL